MQTHIPSENIIKDKRSFITIWKGVLFSSSHALFEEDSTESILCLLIDFVEQLMQLVYNRVKVIEDLEAKVSYLQRQECTKVY